jgi:hypothetical protein
MEGFRPRLLVAAITASGSHQYTMSMTGAAIPVEQIIYTARPVDYSKI